MKYHKTDRFQKEENDAFNDAGDEVTKQIVVINLEEAGAFDRETLDGYLNQAIQESEEYTIYNLQKGLLVERTISKKKITS